MKNASAYIWGIIARAAPSLIYLVTTMVLARFLAPSEFGKIGVLSIIVAIANVLIDSGLGGSLIKEKEISRLDCSTIATFNIAVGIFFYLLIFVLSPQIEKYYAVEGLSKVARLLMLTFLIGPICLVPRTMLYRNLEFRKLCLISVISTLIAAIFAILCAVKHMQVYSLVVFFVGRSLCETIFTCWTQKYKLVFGFSMDSFKRLIPFGFFTTVISIIDAAYENLLTTLTGKYLSIESAGYVNQSKKAEELLSTSVATAIGNVTFPIITKLRDNLQVFVNEADSIFKIILFLVAPILLMVSIFSREVIVLMYGAQWEAAAPYLSWLVIAGLFMIMETLIRTFIKSLNQVDKLMNITFVKRALGILVVLGCLWVDPKYMLYGYVGSSFIAFLLNSLLYSKLVGSTFLAYMRKTIMVLLPSIGFFVFLQLVHGILPGGIWIRLSIGCALLLVFYVIVLPAYKIVTPETIRFAISHFRNR